MRYGDITERISPCYVPIRVLAVADDEVQLSDDKMAMGVGKMRGAARGSLKFIHTSTVWLPVHIPCSVTIASRKILMRPFGLAPSSKMS